MPDDRNQWRFGFSMGCRSELEGLQLKRRSILSKSRRVWEDRNADGVFGANGKEIARRRDDQPADVLIMDGHRERAVAMLVVYVLLQSTLIAFLPVMLDTGQVSPSDLVPNSHEDFCAPVGNQPRRPI